MNVLSLFDGMSCGQIALERANIVVDNYYASEVKKSAIKVALDNYPNTIQIGDVTKLSYKDGILHTENSSIEIGNIDLLIGGSPCQDFSRQRTASGLEVTGLRGEKSKLFYEYLRLLKEINPKYFLLENVRMKKESKQQLDDYLGVKGVFIDSRLVSFQTRDRCYWTNIPNITILDDKNIDFQDFIDTDFDYCKQFKVNNTPSRVAMWNEGKGRINIKSCTNITKAKKIGCLTRKQDRAPNSGLIEFDDFCRYLTRRELELAQTVPITYTKSVSNNQAQDLLGDGWTIDVISHIFEGLNK